MDMYMIDSIKPYGFMENGFDDMDGEELFKASDADLKDLGLDNDNDYFNCLLNDPMISQSAELPMVNDEHSYCSSSSASSSASDSSPSSPMDESVTNTTNNNNDIKKFIKKEPISDSDEELDVTTEDIRNQSQPTTVIKQPAIYLRTGTKKAISVKTEDGEGIINIDMPPTPPSDDCGGSTNSSPGSTTSSQCTIKSRLITPGIRQTPLQRQQQAIRHQHHHIQTSPYSQPLFVSPIPTSGVLILTEEEKRTLVSEGYSIPNKLPLTKQEEKNLKKIRRKIKNKISAQESRRKKKEYVESLEKRMEAFAQENNDLRKKMEQLENHNRSLLVKVQSLLSKGATTQTAGTCVMVLVLCFAVFLGSSSLPNSVWGFGYSKSVVQSPVSVFNDYGLGIQMGYEYSSNEQRYCFAATPFGVGGRGGRILTAHKDDIIDVEKPVSYKDMLMKLFKSSPIENNGYDKQTDIPVLIRANYMPNNKTYSVPN